MLVSSWQEFLLYQILCYAISDEKGSRLVNRFKCDYMQLLLMIVRRQGRYEMPMSLQEIQKCVRNGLQHERMYAILMN